MHRPMLDYTASKEHHILDHTTRIEHLIPNQTTKIRHPTLKHTTSVKRLIAWVPKIISSPQFSSFSIHL